MVPGFGYDIFISYRHNDNRSGWVTDFVNALQEELAGTIKEPLSIYFDKNPHDGLHEHHDVDESLKDKLNCLILIPILSLTYCDPKSFAFEHELKPFVQMALSDSLGLKVKLPNGNVASRVLPVRIHDMDKEDTATFESVVDSVIRSIDFVFQSTGVNRPLRSVEEHPNDNQKKTYYRDQINKVANAIREIVAGLRQSKDKPTSERFMAAQANAQTKAGKKWRVPVIIGAAILLTASFVWLILIPPSLKPASESGLAVLPFTNNSGRADMDFLSVGMASEIRNRLSMSKGFEFISALQSTLAYIKSPKTPKEVGADLGVDYILSGIYQTDGNRIRVEAEFLDAKTGRLVWSLLIEKELSGIFEMQDEIASEVIKRFSAIDQLANDVGGTTNMEAYEAYAEGIRLWESSLYADSSNYKAIALLKKAIQLDSGYAHAWISLIDIETWQHINDINNTTRVVSITKSVAYVRSHFPNYWVSDLADGFYFYRIVRDFDLALISFNRVLEKDPNNRNALAMISAIYKRKLQYEKSLNWRRKQIQLVPTNGQAWDEVAIVLADMGDVKNALKVRLKVWDLVKTQNAALNVLGPAAEAGYAIEKLPEELLKKADYWPDIWKANLTTNWIELLKVAKKAKDWHQTTFAFHMLNQRDSATYWAEKLLLNEPYNWRMLAIIGEHENSMRGIDDFYEHLIHTGNDRQQQCYKMRDQIEALVLLKDYPEATRLLKKLNDDFPEYQNFERYFRPGLYDVIKKEYPTFSEVLKNLKRRPVPDVSQYIKLD